MLFFDLSNFIQYILSQFTANPATLTFLLLIEFSDGFVQKKSFWVVPTTWIATFFLLVLSSFLDINVYNMVRKTTKYAWLKTNCAIPGM